MDEWEWSSCAAYYGKYCFPGELLESSKVFRMFSDDFSIARERFREFNERRNWDQCLDERPYKHRRLPDEEARLEIKRVLGRREIAQVKSLPKFERDMILREIKDIDGLTQRQAARILGIPPSLVFKT